MNKGLSGIFFTLLFLSVTLLTGFKVGNEDKVEVTWMSFEEAVEASKQNPKKIFIDVYTDWCGWCKVMDKNTFSHETVARYLNENYYSVKLDAEGKEEITFNDHTYKYVSQGRKGVHELAYALLNGNLSYPTVVFLDEEFRMITPVSGYQKPEQFYPILTFIGENHYKKTKWEEYRSSFENPF